MTSHTIDPIDPPRVLIVGAGFAGLAAAHWMRQIGYAVTVVESGERLKKGGTPVDIRDETVGIVKRMGIFDAVRAASLPPRLTEFTDLSGVVQARMVPEPVRPGEDADGYEIPRDDLLEILFDRVREHVDLRFRASVSQLTDIEGGARVVFDDGTEGEFAFVLGCDGNHSTVRRLRFGPETQYSHFLHHYFTVAIVDELLLPADTTRILNTPGKTVMLNGYEDKTDISFSFQADAEIEYDYHDAQQQKQIVAARFESMTPEIDRMLTAAAGADNFYFDKLSQTKMPTWTSGRVALVGDAGYCASPAAGMGGSLAIIGATALHDALQQHPNDIDAAFSAYERDLRPIVDEIQAGAVEFGLPTFFPDTAEAIEARNAFLTQ